MRSAAKRSPIKSEQQDDWLSRLISSGEIRRDASRDDGFQVLIYRPEGPDNPSRNTLAEDLHDHAGQFIAGLFLRLNILSRYVDSDAGRDQIEHMRAQLDQLADELSRLPEGARPPALEFGLPAAIAALLKDWEKIAGFSVDFECSHPKLRLDPDIELALYRIAQEALSNLVKHAPSSTNVAVTLRCSGNDWEFLSISDDGPGFDAGAYLSAPVPKGKLGLAGMRRRLLAIGGDLEILSSPALGTSIVARRNPAATAR